MALSCHELVQTNLSIKEDLKTVERTENFDLFGRDLYSANLKEQELLSESVTFSQSNYDRHVCELCSERFDDQFKFYEHLKVHYEDISIMGSVNPLAGNEELPHGINNLNQLDKTFCTDTRENICQTERVRVDTSMNAISTGIDGVLQMENDISGGCSFDVGPSGYPADDDFAENNNLFEPLFSCPFCDHNYPSAELIDAHILVSHKEAFSEETSKTCKASTTLDSSQIPTVFNCTLCERQFSNKNSLTYHLRSHSGERPYECETCSKKFFSSSALKVHSRQHSGERPYICKDCNKGFRQWGDLKYHQQSIHSGERAFQCEFCEKKFARNYSLVIHRRVHTGERTYKCDICSKSFRAACYLNNHRKIHTGEKAHGCSICAKRFRMKSDLARHLLSHEKKFKHVEITITPLEVVEVGDDPTDASRGPANAKKFLLAPASHTSGAEVTIPQSDTATRATLSGAYSHQIEVVPSPLPYISINGQNSTIIGELAIANSDNVNLHKDNNLPNNIVIFDYLK